MSPRFEAKGTHILQAKSVIEELLGRGSFRLLAAEAGADPGWDALVMTGWYDVFVLQRMLEQAALESKRSLISISTDIARKNALGDFKGVHRMFMRVAQPVRMLYFVPQLWRSYVSFGDTRVLENEPGWFVGETANIPELLLDWACGAWLGFIPQGIQLAGGKVASAKIITREGTGLSGRVVLEVKYQAP
jgi:hypothetical protein